MIRAAQWLWGQILLIAFFGASVSQAQQTRSVDATATGPVAADPGRVSGSAWLWLLFVVVCIVVIFVLSRRQRGN